MGKFNLNIAEDKTKIIRFGRYAAEQRERQGKGKPETFDFLGFTHYCSKKRDGTGFRVKRKTSSKKMKQKVKAMKIWIRQNRHMSLEEFLSQIRAKLSGHYQYYGITDNYARMQLFYYETMKLIFKWRNRRSQRRSFTWEKYNKMLPYFKLPKPRILINIYDMSKKTDTSFKSFLTRLDASVNDQVRSRMR